MKNRNRETKVQNMKEFISETRHGKGISMTLRGTLRYVYTQPLINYFPLSNLSYSQGQCNCNNCLPSFQRAERRLSLLSVSLLRHASPAQLDPLGSIAYQFHSPKWWPVSKGKSAFLFAGTSQSKLLNFLILSASYLDRFVANPLCGVTNPLLVCGSQFLPL